MHTIMRCLIFLPIFLVMSGCGFALRGAPPLPESVKGVAIIGASPQARLARSINDRLSVYQIPVVNDVEDKDAILIRLQPEQLERRLLSVFPTGQVAEYELIYTVAYQVTFPQKETAEYRVEVLRDYQDDPDQVLAKARELELVVSEMRDEAADRIIRLLPSQSN